MNEHVRRPGHATEIDFDDIKKNMKKFLDGYWGQIKEGLEDQVWKIGRTWGNTRGQISRDKYILISTHSLTLAPPTMKFSGWGECHIVWVCVCSLHRQAGMRYTYRHQLARLGAGGKLYFPRRLHTLGKSVTMYTTMNEILQKRRLWFKNQFNIGWFDYQQNHSWHLAPSSIFLDELRTLT